MGTPEMAVPTLTELVAGGHDLAAVYTQPPRPAGRGQSERKSPIHRAAAEFGLGVRTPNSFKSDADRAAFVALDADVAVVVAYGLLLPGPILEAPRFGCLNLHGSKLPRWRGAAPIQRAIMAGDTETAVEVMKMDEGLDTGPVALCDRIEIDPDVTAGDLHDEMKIRGADLMIRALSALERGALDFASQPDGGVTYAKKIDKAETLLDFHRTSHDIHNTIRGLSPRPGARFSLELNGRKVRIKILKSTLSDASGTPGTIIDDQLTIACGTGAVRLQVVQREGKSAMSAAEFLRGAGALKKRTVA